MGSQPEQAPRVKCVKHPQVLFFSEVWPPRQALGHCIRASYASLGRVEAVFAPDTSTDVVLGGTFALEEAERKTQALCLWEGMCLIHRAGSLREQRVKCHWDHRAEGNWASPRTCLALFPGLHCLQNKPKFFIMAQKTLHVTPALLLVTLLFLSALHWVLESPCHFWGLLKLCLLPGQLSSPFIWEMPRSSQVSQRHHFLWKPSYTRLGVPPLRPRIHCPPSQCDLACSSEKSLLGWSRDSTCCSHIDGGRMTRPWMLLPGRNSLHLWGCRGPVSQLAGDWPALCFRLSDSPRVISIRSVPAFCRHSPNPSPEFELSWSKWAGSLAG